MTSTQRLRDSGEVGKLRGMELAAGAKLDRVATGKIALLRALFASPDGIGSLDDATGDLSAEFCDGGKWRGTICRSLAMARIIEKVDVVQSDRPSRHRGYLSRWRLVDRRKASLTLAGLVAAMDTRLSTAATLAAESETPPIAVGDASIQQSFPQFKEGIPNGKTI